MTITKSKFSTMTFALLTTLAVVGEAREGTMYAALMGVASLDEFQTVIGFLAHSGYVTLGAGHLVTITPKGRDIASKLDAAAKEDAQ